jgi:hypothetical protein
MSKINFFFSKTSKPVQNPSTDGIAKTPITTRKYSASMSESKKRALEVLHSTREQKHALQRELFRLKQTKTKEERHIDEAILEARIQTTASLEMDAELAFKYTK